jgi:hypothetical protein
MGARWRHRGRSVRFLDCLGLLELSAVNSGLEFERVPVRYGREPWDDQLRKGLVKRFGVALSAEAASVGDVALIRWGIGEPSHVGIIGDHPAGGLSLIHAHIIHGVIEQGLVDHIKAAVVEVYRPDWSRRRVD